MSDRKIKTDFDPEEERKYFHALGVFIEGFALTEVGMFHLLVLFSGLSLKKAQALLSGAKVDQCIQFIKRLWVLEPPPVDLKIQLEDAFEHLQIINEMRNRIVHNASTTYEDGRVVNNETRQLREIKEDKLSPEILIQMAKDCGKINAVLRLALVPDGFRERDAKILERAWLYKPVPNASRLDKK